MLRAAARRPRRRRKIPIASKLATLTLLLLLIVGGFAGYSELRFRRMSEALDAQIATYKRQRWERPVLRGAAGEGNAAVAALVALRGFDGLDGKQRDALASQLFYGQPLPAQLQTLVQQHAVLIDGLRAATRLSWAMTEVPAEQGPAARVPAYPKVMDAVLLMLGRAAGSGPQECMAIAADAIRLGQDLVPGAPLEAASISMRITSVATPVITRCAAAGDADAVLRAARELDTLATHAPSAGGGIELADLLAAVELRDLAVLFPKDSSDSALRRLRRRPALFEAWSHFANPARWRALGAAHYPQSLETWLRENEWRNLSGLPLVADATAPVQGWLYDDMRGQALLRVLTVGLATLAERARRQRTPREPLSLNEPTLCDPYNGQPLKWRIAQDGGELTIWSVGEDRRDDKGSSDWAPQAPLDVVVHFPLRSLARAEAPRRSRH